MTKFQQALAVALLAAGIAWWWQRRQEAAKKAQDQKDLAAGLNFATAGVFGSEITSMLGGATSGTLQ